MERMRVLVWAWVESLFLLSIAILATLFAGAFGFGLYQLAVMLSKLK